MLVWLHTVTSVRLYCRNESHALYKRLPLYLATCSVNNPWGLTDSNFKNTNTSGEYICTATYPLNLSECAGEGKSIKVLSSDTWELVHLDMRLGHSLSLGLITLLHINAAPDYRHYHWQYSPSDNKGTWCPCAINTPGALNAISRVNALNTWMRGTVLQDLHICLFFCHLLGPVAQSQWAHPQLSGLDKIRLLTHAFSTHSSHERSFSLSWIHE